MDYNSDDLYDEYDGDSYDQGEEELSPEDQASMAQGTEDVKTQLGADSSKVTTKQIQDALWHYYYDVEKSVSYLKNTYVSPPPKPTPKKAPEGTFHAVSFSDILSVFETGPGADDERQKTPYQFHLGTRKALNKLAFSDMPWMNVPKDRLTSFVPPAKLPGGLLGGSDAAPKMSKLQALAAARKKKTEDRRNQEQVARGVGRLSVSEEPAKENKSPLASIAKRQKTTSQTSQETVARSRPPPLSETGVNNGTEPTAIPKPPAHLEARPAGDEITETVPASSPSAFAQALFRSAPDSSSRLSRSVYAMPHTTSPHFDALAFAKPSPDDIVLAAQSQAGKKTQASPKTAKKNAKQKGDGKEADAVNGMAKLKVADIPPPKGKGLDVVKEFEARKGKRNASFVVVGHVDAGKSTLMGRLLVSLKYVEERTIEKLRRLGEESGKQSFALAWVMDQRSEERDRGVTIDIATNHFETETTKFTILDAPGHQDFVPNMIAGASQADFALLVIDANTGAYEKGLKGQTKEHVLLLRSLGVQRLVIAINKLDMVGWSRDRFEEIHEQVKAFLVGLGFQNKAIQFIPISGLDGDNIVEKKMAAAASWYSGDSLIQALEAAVPPPPPSKSLGKPFRMSVSELFRSQQGTTTLGGRVDAGTIQVGDVVVVQPSAETAYVKSVMVDQDSQDWAVAGQNITMALSDIDPIHIRVGDILCAATPAADVMSCSDRFTMKALAFEHLMPMPVDVHRGRLHAPGQLYSIAATLDKSTGHVVKKRPRIVQPSEVARVSIKLDSKVPLEAGQRVVIRSQGETIAAGLIE